MPTYTASYHLSEVCHLREALKTAREEWDKDLAARANQSVSHLDPNKYDDHYGEKHYEARKRIEPAKWRNVSVDDLMYAEKIHFTYKRYHINGVNLAPPIIEAAMKGHSEIVELLLDHGADVEILVEHPLTGRSGNVSLAVAARQDSMIILYLNIDYVVITIVKILAWNG